MSSPRELADAIQADWYSRCDAKVKTGELVRLPDENGERRYAQAGSPAAEQAGSK